MTFRLLDYADELGIIEESSTQLTVNCPVCYGKIRINKRSSAYKCVSGECLPVDIRKALNVHAPEFVPKPYIPPRPVPFPSQPLLHQTTGKFELDTSVYFSRHIEDRQRVKRTVFKYDKYHQIVRIDQLVTGGKRFYPLTYSIEKEKWELEADDPYPLLNQELITEFKTVLFVEGEKCAIETCRHGLLALTAPSFAWSERRLENALEPLVFKVQAIVAIPDNDDTGMRKMLKFQQTCWKVGLPCKIVTLDPYYTEKGDDIYDVIKQGVDISSLIFGKLKNGCEFRNPLPGMVGQFN